MTKKQARKLLRRAAQLIDERGWTKGTWGHDKTDNAELGHGDIVRLVQDGNGDRICNMCAVGALAYAVAEQPGVHVDDTYNLVAELRDAFHTVHDQDPMRFNDQLPYGDLSPWKVRTALLDTAAAL